MQKHFEPNIYIVDGNLYYQKVITACLEALNYTSIKCYSNAEACLSVSSGSSPDIIVLDYNLGDGKMDGLELMKHFAELPHKPYFIFLSSNIKVEIAVDAVRNGAADYILKSKSGIVRLAKQIDILQARLEKEARTQSRLLISA